MYNFSGIIIEGKVDCLPIGNGFGEVLYFYLNACNDIDEEELDLDVQENFRIPVYVTTNFQQHLKCKDLKVGTSIRIFGKIGETKANTIFVYAEIFELL